jgi:RNA polymerase sigma factor (sigma-70 family)
MLMVGDEAQLYDSLATRLEQIVRKEVRAPREVIEDACHHAWTKLFNHSEQVDRGAALNWLATTAIRQAWKLDRRERRELSLEAAAEDVGELPIPSRLPGPVEHLEFREHLGQLRDLPQRQQRLIWLRAAGLSYVEMAAYTGDSVRTVERQVLRATARMRSLHTRTPQRELQAESGRTAINGPSGRYPSIDERGLER